MQRDQTNPPHASPTLAQDDMGDPFSVRVLHSALVIIVLVVVAIVVVPFTPASMCATLAGWHHGLGLIAWGFTYALLAVRGAHRQRGSQALTMPGVDVLCRFVSLMIYICLLALPPIGFLAASAHGRTVPIFTDGLLRALPLYDLPHAAIAIGFIHRALAWALFALIALHLGLSILRRASSRSRATMQVRDTARSTGAR